MNDTIAEREARAAILLGELAGGWRKRVAALAGQYEPPPLRELDRLIAEEADRERARAESTHLEPATEGGVLMRPASARAPMRARAQRWQGRPGKSA